jgi:hypothetical protein
LDEVLQQRQGEPFAIPEEDVEEVAAIAAALHAIAPGDRGAMAGAHPASGPSPSEWGAKGWKRTARVEGVRG